jgi:hypothetical protein
MQPDNKTLTQYFKEDYFLMFQNAKDAELSYYTEYKTQENLGDWGYSDLTSEFISEGIEFRIKKLDVTYSIFKTKSYISNQNNDKTSCIKTFKKCQDFYSIFSQEIYNMAMELPLKFSLPKSLDVDKTFLCGYLFDKGSNFKNFSYIPYELIKTILVTEHTHVMTFNQFQAALMQKK